MASTPEKMPDAFLSYTRSDDKYSGGKITMFREHLEEAVQAVTGKPFEIFQDVEGIGLGEHWPERLDEILDQTRFFLPMVTPSYFESTPCRDELQRFLEAEQRAGRKDLILPIYCIEAELLEEETLRSEDQLAVIIHERQRHDWRGLLFEPFESKEAKISLQELACKIKDAKKRFVTADSSRQPDTSNEVGNRTQVQVAEPEPEHIASKLHLSPGTIFRDVDEPWCPEMVVIPPGVFDMGSPVDEVERRDSEGPQHQVKIEQPFTIGRFPVTRGEFEAFAKETGHESKGANVWRDSEWTFDKSADWRSPGFAQDDDHPVVCVGQNDTLAYLAWLSGKTGKRYVLPSEAMWEYACRAGSTTPFWVGSTISVDKANYNGIFPYGTVGVGEFRKSTTEIGSFSANPFGLHDMHGNVWEWCADHWHQTYEGAPTDNLPWLENENARHVIRGGSWTSGARRVRAAVRSARDPSFRGSHLGFRCARVED